MFLLLKNKLMIVVSCSDCGCLLFKKNAKSVVSSSSRHIFTTTKLYCNRCKPKYDESISLSGKIIYKINGSFDCDVNGKIKNT